MAKQENGNGRVGTLSMSDERLFITDDDGHWYLIVPDDKYRFIDLLDQREYDELYNVFGYYRCDHTSRYTVKVID